MQPDPASGSALAASSRRLPFPSHPKTRSLFGIDLRALAAMRIALGALLLYDLLVVRARGLVPHYSGSGIVPLEAVGGPTLYALSGSPVFVALLFVLAALLAVMLIVGYHTWFATASSWFMLASLQMRDRLVNNSGDQLLACLLLWGMFLPLGARASVDSRTSPPRSRPPGMVLSVASVALLLQVVYMYLFTALIKSKSVWVTQGSAVYDALNLDLYVKPLGRAMLRFPGLVRMSSPAVYFLEMCGPLLAFVPRCTPFFRTLTALVFLAFHLLLQVSFHLDLFAFASMIAWLAFLPAEFWDRVLAARVGRTMTQQWATFVGGIARRVSAAAGAHPWLPAPPVAGRASVPGRVLAAAVLLYISYWNLGTVSERLEMPKTLAWVGKQFFLAQEWRMFAPRPWTEEGWWVIPSMLEDGSVVDLFTQAPVRWEKPRSPLGRFTAPRWRKYLENLWTEEYREHAANFAAWLRREWDARHAPSQRVASMKMFYMLERTRPRYLPPQPSPRLVYEWDGPGREHVVPYSPPEPSREDSR